MNGVDVFLLGRSLARLGVEAIPAPEGATIRGTRASLVVLCDIVEQPGTTVSQVAARTALPQSQVSVAVARLLEAGSIRSDPDPRDGRRRLLRPAEVASDRVLEVRAASIEDAVRSAVSEPTAATEVLDALEVLARHLLPRR